MTMHQHAQLDSGRALRIGLMSFAHVHAAGYARTLHAWPGVEVLCADPDGAAGPADEVRGAAFAAELGVPYTEMYEELFAWQPDAVVVCSENTRHRPLVERAAEAGVHVLCEKPLATTAADAQAMIDVCERAGVFLMTAFPVRFAPSFEALRALVRSGELGEILGATGTNNGRLPSGRAWFTDPALSGGGAVVDHTVHVADLLDSLIGQRAVRVRAVSNRILHGDNPKVSAESGGLVSITYAGGVVATIDCSWSQPAHAPTWGGVTLEIVGTNGTVRIDPYAARVGGFDENAGGEVWIPYGPNLDHLMLAAFLDGVRSGQAPQPDGHVALRTVQIIAAAQESVRIGQPVSLNDVTPSTPPIHGDAFWKQPSVAGA